MSPAENWTKPRVHLEVGKEKETRQSVMECNYRHEHNRMSEFKCQSHKSVQVNSSEVRRARALASVSRQIGIPILILEPVSSFVLVTLLRWLKLRCSLSS